MQLYLTLVMYFDNKSFGQSYPEELDGTLDCSSIALTCRFNRWGSLLAVGCNDGRVLIFDFITRGIVKAIAAHVQPVCSLSWSRDGYKLLTASTDNTVAIWNVLTGECDRRFRFASPVLSVQFHPRNKRKFLICPLKHPAILVDLDGTHAFIPTEDELCSDSYMVASFDRRGQYLISGNSKGKINVYLTDTVQVVASFRLPSCHCVRSIETSKREQNFLSNSNDRVIRIFDLEQVLKAGINGDPEPVHKLQDLVNKTPWKVCCFSGDNEYVCGGSARTHAVYIWEKNSGSLVKILHGVKGEQLLDLVWHPARPLVCSISNGIVSVWSQTHVENWSAFAPDFKELDENVEYEERESEFDLEDEDKSVQLNAVRHIFSDEEGSQDDVLWYLPIAPEIEDPEENIYANLPTTDSSADIPAEQQSLAVSGTKKLPSPVDIPVSGSTTIDELLVMTSNAN
ncbi:unnamed protein product [Soboliphyme baturini]|uniref:WD_REPEATS_REGION domain-containing protein n=1 Tax=Soboliphyme baturini TaxID=241478 RepID=A0A183IMA9_9BILA|nr:unnamed protein product [Soboliphyme baturini]